MKNRFIHYGLVLLIIAGVSAGILGIVNGFTSGVIKTNGEKVVNEARKNVLPLADEFKSDEVVIVESENLEFIPGYKDGQIVGYVTTVNQNGYAGTITFVMGMDINGVITGINVTNSQETPGLGAKIQEKDWQEHWIGKDASYSFNKGVDAFAGATISPQAVYNGLMRALNTFKNEVSSNEK